MGISLREIEREEFDKIVDTNADNYFQNGCIFDEDDNLIAFELLDTRKNIFLYFRIIKS